MDGLINGRVELATRGPARTTGQIALAEVDAQAAAKFFGLGMVKGAVAGRAGFTIPDLSGQAVGQSKIDGKLTVLDGALLLPESALGPTNFRSANLSLILSDGRIHIEDLALRKDGAAITGRLGVSLADSTLEGRLQDAKGTTVELGGTMSAPFAKTILIGTKEIDVAVAKTEPKVEPTTPRATEETPRTATPEPATDGSTATVAEPDNTADAAAESVEPVKEVALPTQNWSETRAETLAAASAIIAAIAEREAAANEADAARRANGANASTTSSATTTTTTANETTTETATEADTTSPDTSDERTAEIDPRFPIPIPAPR